MNSIAFLGFRISINGPPKIRPIIEKPPKKINPVPSISNVQPFSVKIKIIEDCAHAIETIYKGRKAGAIGDMGVFSFYATKNLTTGEGGMLITKDKKILSRVKIMRLHGMTKDAWKRHLKFYAIYFFIIITSLTPFKTECKFTW